MNNKKAKFYCENCGAVVPGEAKVCRHCGRFFASVRCSKCGTTGSAEKFANGCPTCGFKPDTDSVVKNNYKEKKAGFFSRHRLKSAIKNRSGDFNNSQSMGEDSLPWWMYVLTGIILAAVISIFLHFLK